MTFVLLSKSAAEALHVEGPEFGSVLREVLDRISVLIQHSETDISNLMQTQAGHGLVNLNVIDLDDGDPDRYSSDWDNVVLATPEPLTDAEYNRVLLGEDPKAGDVRPIELYGARVKIKP
jgi:hypothetical protein